MKKAVITAAIAATCAFALGVGMVGCSCSSDSVTNASGGSAATQSASGSGASSSTVSSNATDFPGSWVAVGGNFSDVTLTTDALTELADRGMYASAVFDSNGTVTFDTFGAASSGTWKKASDNVATVTVGGTEHEASLSNGILSIEFDGYLIEYAPGDVVASTVSEAVVTEAIIASAISDATGEQVYTDEEKVEKAVASDAKTTATVVSKAKDEAGLVGFKITIANNTDHAIEATIKPHTFTVNGKQLDPFLDDTIESGKSVESFVFFFADDLSNVDELSNVKGTIWLLDKDGEDDQELNVEF